MAKTIELSGMHLFLPHVNCVHVLQC